MAFSQAGLKGRLTAASHPLVGDSFTSHTPGFYSRQDESGGGMRERLPMPGATFPTLPHPLAIVLVAPQIPPNTGNVARLCAVTGCRLHLVEPLGFSIADRQLKRAGLDYWDKVFVKLHPSFDAYLGEHHEARRVLFSARAGRSLYAVRFQPGDHLVFGSETDGLPAEALAGSAGEVAAIPMLAQRRSLNLSTAVGIATYEALRQLTAAGQ